MMTASGMGAAGKHLRYIQRDGVGAEGREGELYGAREQAPQPEDFIERSKGDPHQFRFIVSPEDAERLDLTAYTRKLMGRVEGDIERPLDWVAVNHYNTEHPHVHVIIRGRSPDSDELRMHRQYVSHHFRDRARELATQELGPRLEHEVEATRGREVQQERFTSLDASLSRLAQGEQVDLGAVPGERAPQNLDRYLVGRLRHLERLGLAAPTATRCYRLDPQWRERLTALGERGDVIKEIHRAVRAEGLAYRIAHSERDPYQVVGRVARKGLSDELRDRYYAVVETTRGEAFYLTLPAGADPDQLTHGAVVRLSNQPAANTRTGFAYAQQVLDARDLEAQVVARGPSWLDEVNPEGLAIHSYGAEVRAARARRQVFLEEQLGVKPNAADTGQRLEAIERAELGRGHAASGLAYRELAPGMTGHGRLHSKITAASGREYALIETQREFMLVPWRTELSRSFGRNVAYRAEADGRSVAWALGKGRGR